MTTTTIERIETRAEPRHWASVRLLRKAAVALAGLGLLGTEFPTARRISTALNTQARAAWHKLRTVMPGAGTRKH